MQITGYFLQEDGHDNIDAQVVKQAVLQAIKKWSDEQDD